MVPIEKSTVRFIDNFSAGTRGSASAEYFLKKGYAVIFLSRRGSLQPFDRRITALNRNVLDVFDLDHDGSAIVKPPYLPVITSAVADYASAVKDGRLLVIEFVSLDDYLHLLALCCDTMSHFKHRAMVYLAAAVSDFYIPLDLRPQHKIQSSEGKLHLSMDLVPKLLAPLVFQKVPDAFTVSFKLETDSSLLLSKARGAIEKYHHQLVIGNLLDTRKKEVIFIDKTLQETWHRLTDEQVAAGFEIEEIIVKHLCELHAKHIADHDSRS